jgi:hypothetical protein
MGMLEPTAVSPLNIVLMASSLALMDPSVNVRLCENKMIQVEPTINATATTFPMRRPFRLPSVKVPNRNTAREDSRRRITPFVPMEERANQ